MLTVGLIKYDMTEKSGGDRVAAILSRELAKYYHIHLISINGKGEKPFYKVDEKVVYAPLLAGHGRMRKTLLPAGLALRRYVKEHKIDVLLTIGGNVNLFMLMASVGKKVKTVFCEHMNLIVANRSRSNRVMRDVGVRFVDKVITLTKRDREAYISHYKLPEDRVGCIYNWMDDALFGTAVEYDVQSKRIITVGSLGSAKGYDMLVKVAELVFQKHPDWRWDIYGDGDLYETVQKDIQSYGLENNLHLMGATNAIYDKYPDYAFYVMTSRNEGLPIVLLEAKAKGLPVVSFDCMTGPAEIVNDGVDGFLVPPENIGQMAEQICLLIENPQLRQQLADHARDNVELFGRERIVDQWRNLIDTLCAKQGTGDGVNGKEN